MVDSRLFEQRGRPTQPLLEDPHTYFGEAYDELWHRFLKRPTFLRTKKREILRAVRLSLIEEIDWFLSLIVEKPDYQITPDGITEMNRRLINNVAARLALTEDPRPRPRWSPAQAER